MQRLEYRVGAGAERMRGRGPCGRPPSFREWLPIVPHPSPTGGHKGPYPTSQPLPPLREHACVLIFSAISLLGLMRMPTITLKDVEPTMLANRYRSLTDPGAIVAQHGNARRVLALLHAHGDGQPVMLRRALEPPR